MLSSFEMPYFFSALAFIVSYKSWHLGTPPVILPKPSTPLVCYLFNVGYSLGVSIRLAGSSSPLPRVNIAMLFAAYILAIEWVIVEQEGLYRPPEPKAFQTSWLVSL